MVPEVPDTLSEQMRALLPDDSSSVSAEEAMSIAAIRARGNTGRAREDRVRFPLRRPSPARLRRPAWAWLAVIAVLAVVLVIGFKALPSPKSSNVPASKPGQAVTSTTTTISRRVAPPTKPLPGTWSSRVLVKTGVAQDIAPTTDGVYWLTYNANPAARTPVTPFRYIPASGRLIKGPAITGNVGSPAITATGGWVWVVVGTGDTVLVEQLDISTLTLHSSESLTVKNNLFGPLNNPGGSPVLTATINGPLWVAGGEDLWELNPTTGAVETEFDTGNQIVSMSTDPTGNILYTGGWSTMQGDMTVTEYDAHTGKRLRQSNQQAASPGTVAAIVGGVWVTLRSGNYGRAFELSVNRLSEMAPPSNVATSQGIYDQIGGVEASISEGTLWLSGTDERGVGSLTCADPATGTVRASESVQVGGPIASGSLLYAFEGSDLVALTPPAKCFG
jgi:hypothetical protein